MKKFYQVEGKFAYIVPDEIYCTNYQSEGLFYISHGEKRQLVGTCDFYAKNLNSFKYKLRKYLKKFEK